MPSGNKRLHPGCAKVFCQKVTGLYKAPDWNKVIYLDVIKDLLQNLSSTVSHEYKMPYLRYNDYNYQLKFTKTS
ncbi:8890_t:CDS:2 [Entrophospora sp. SA101]|nr:8890_t:CDS:2 [Entrophospora sp. SA101]